MMLELALLTVVVIHLIQELCVKIGPLLEVVVPAEDTCWDVVEEMPSFPGGPSAMLAFIDNVKRYPVGAEELCAQGRVIVRVVVEKDGSLRNIKVVKSVDPSLDKEAIRVVEQMPKWIPGKQDGKPVRVKYFIPISFRLP
jgi:protein TonB